MKQSIHDYHFLTPGTAKWIKSKDSNNVPEEHEVDSDLDDQSDYFKIGFTIYKAFKNVKHKEKIIGYDSKHRLYEIKYKYSDKEEFYHNEIDAHHDKVKTLVANYDY